MNGGGGGQSVLRRDGSLASAVVVQRVVEAASTRGVAVISHVEKHTCVGGGCRTKWNDGTGEAGRWEGGRSLKTSRCGSRLPIRPSSNRPLLRTSNRSGRVSSLLAVCVHPTLLSCSAGVVGPRRWPHATLCSVLRIEPSQSLRVRREVRLCRTQASTHTHTQSRTQMSTHSVMTGRRRKSRTAAQLQLTAPTPTVTHSSSLSHF